MRDEPPFFDLSKVKKLSEMEHFPDSNVDLRNLKFTEDEIAKAMNFDTEDVDHPKGNPLSPEERRLVTYYTREGYYDMNSILTGNITKIAERYLQSQEIGPRDFTKVHVSIENETLTATYKISDDDPDEKRIFESGSDEYKGILQQTKNALVQASLLTKALEKLPSFSSDDLNRKVACNNEDSLNIILKKYNPRELPLPFDKMVNVSSEGVIVTENRFMSTSKNPCANKDFGGSFEFHIKARGGKDIQPFSCRPDEEEVVLLPGTKLQIIGIMKLSLDEENPDPRYVISCRQIEDKKEKSDESTC